MEDGRGKMDDVLQRRGGNGRWTKEEGRWKMEDRFAGKRGGKIEIGGRRSEGGDQGSASADKIRPLHRQRIKS